VSAGPTGAHRRWNPLAQRWILVTPGRLARPWQGQLEGAPIPAVSSYDPSCYMCPGNRRASGVANPDYTGPFVFDNDFPALQLEPATVVLPGHELLRAEPVTGVCRVVCYTPRHDATLAQLSDGEIRQVVDCWADELVALRRRPTIATVQIFENRGAMMGASNPHPHGQIWATSIVPDEVHAESRAQAEYYAGHGGADLLGDYLTHEMERATRVVSVSDDWVCLVPFWATWPFETLVMPRRQVASVEDLTPAERDHLAQMLGRLARGYDRLFAVPFPYSMGIHVRPGVHDQGWRLHLHFYPPLLRSATVRKFMVGFELLGMAQRDFTPEEAAGWLRNADVRSDARSPAP
jgi:UDPglucose--hexose-1-phosphate uridylyltransferase